MWYEKLLNKKFLICVNIAYIPVSILPIELGFSYFSVLCCRFLQKIQKPLPFIHGITACGVVLLLLSILGLTSLVKRFIKMQKLYTFLLLILSITQLSISCACFSGNHGAMEEIARYWWNKDNDYAPFDSIHKNEKRFQCCGYDEEDPRRNPNVLDPAMFAERQWCLKNVDSCSVKHLISYFGNENLKSSSALLKLLFLWHRFSNENEASGDLTCMTCKEPVTNQFKKISCFVGGAGLCFSLTEFFY